jgi:hypothetical protein
LPGPFCPDFLRRRFSQTDSVSCLHNLLCDESEKSFPDLSMGFDKAKS